MLNKIKFDVLNRAKMENSNFAMLGLIMNLRLIASSYHAMFYTSKILIFVVYSYAVLKFVNSRA